MVCGRQLTSRCFKHVCHYTLLASVLAVSLLHADVGLNESTVVSSLEHTYGERAGLRAKAWFNILRDAQNQSTIEKITTVNNFFNLFRFVDDIKLWGVSNYWATPLEFIGANGGDCEDFSIAKYFTLLQLGVPDDKMRITMVKATSVNQYHMVLAYYETPGAIPLILDNLDPVIKPATQRTDLIPVYSFNGKQLWLNKEKGRGVLAGPATRLEKWNDLKHRLGADRMRKPKLVME
ncbi:transglutaminase-like cysteine peptidase [Shewanella dokdonensis]|uniref:Transglutaminase-like cysteine peptidase n=1 Tax=Shewanella dokdonensis TaxID=712036 RepID=A0ABX8DHP6_9GAMM|nr:transglutaminase-like cysteine peptidase [Shewanella dokdonensis]MCL1076245.1 transglutaminase-like cysteine peptidase [Shewanella dokdonensis]QVK24288.1 transglutaminase-like cysteine peptidase [Shewanella dokdonensis]